MSFFRVFLSILLVLLCSCTFHRYQFKNRSSQNQNPIKNIKPKLSVELKDYLSYQQYNDSEEKKSSNNITKTHYQSYLPENPKNLFVFHCCLKLQEHAKWQIKYSFEHRADDQLLALTIFPGLLTLLIFPVIEKFEFLINIEIIEKQSNEIRLSYTYPIDELAITSWLTIPFGLVAAIINSDTYTQSAFFSHQHPAKIIQKRFEKDLALDIPKLKLSSKKSINNHNKYKLPANKYAVIITDNSNQKYSKIAVRLHNKLESLLIKKNKQVLERNRLEEVLKEIRLSQQGLTKEGLEVGNLENVTNIIRGELNPALESKGFIELTLKDIDVKTGQIHWKYTYRIDTENPDIFIRSILASLQKRI